MRSFWSEPFLWIHLAGIVVVPLALLLVAMGLAVGDPIAAYWIELLVIAVLGIFPVLWMQWHRPFDIFSLLIVALIPAKMTMEQRKILSLFKGDRQRWLSVITALVMLILLWQIERFAPLVETVNPLALQWRPIGLLIAAVAFLVSNLFVQVPVSVVSALFTSEQEWMRTEPIAVEGVEQEFTVPGIKMSKILPILTSESIEHES